MVDNGIMCKSRNKWKNILISLGIPVKILDHKHHPCPKCGGKDRFRFTNLNGDGLYVCNGCGNGNGMSLAMHYSGMSYHETCMEIEKMIENNSVKPDLNDNSNEDAGKKREMVRSMLKDCNKNDEYGYLKSRGISVSPKVGYHSGLVFTEDQEVKGKFPAFIGVFRDKDNKVTGVQRTYYVKKRDGFHKSKKMLSINGLSGSAVRLFDPVDGRISIGEGIESCSAFTQIFNEPSWAACTSSLLEAFDPPEGITDVIVIGDNDENFKGQKSAYSLANKLKLKGLNVQVMICPHVGKDWADVLWETKINNESSGLDNDRDKEYDGNCFIDSTLIESRDGSVKLSNSKGLEKDRYGNILKDGIVVVKGPKNRSK